MTTRLPFASSLHTRRNERGRRRSLSQTGQFGLEYEKCEDRNMLSASTGSDWSAALDAGQEKMILRYLSETIELAHLQSGANDLQLVHVENQNKQMTAVFQQTMDGIPVHGAFVTVLQNSNGKVLDVDNRAHLYLATLDATPDLDLDSAEEIAHAMLSTRTPWSATGQLVWFSAGGLAELAWQVDTVVDHGDSEIEFTTVVHADTGEMLSQVQSPPSIEAIVNGHETGVFPRIVINDTIGPAGSQAYAAAEPFNSVVALALGCTGTLMAPDVVISARHCGAGSNDQIIFGVDSNSGIYTATVQSSFLPDGSGSLLDGGDVAILTLTADVPSDIATPMRFIDATTELEGHVAATLGYGYNGVGSTGHGFSADGLRWGGENVIDRYGTPASNSGSNIVSTDFEDGTSGSNTIGGSSATPLQYEATTAPGDSGGPVLVQQGGEWLIAGVLSGGTTSTSVYGDISWWTGTAIYRSEIEARGGVFAGDGLGNVSLDQGTYIAGDSVGITVVDDNGISPLNVTLTSDSGDSETITLSNGGNGAIYSGSIGTSDGGVSPGDGTLQVSVADVITVTYVDPDDGTGNSNTVTDTATIIELSDSVLVGIDFNNSGSSTPTNWRSVGSGSDTTINNLSDENGNPIDFELEIVETVDGSWSGYAVTPAASTIPQHTNSLTNIDGQIYTGADPLVLTYKNLTPLANYEIYVMAAEGLFTSINQSVTITGDGTPVTFNQSFGRDELFINDQVGDSSRVLGEYTQIITADADGQIVINVDPVGNTSDVVLSGLAIYELPANEVTPAIGKTADGVVTGGQFSNVFESDNQYLAIDPEATQNPFKQKIEYIVQQVAPTSSPSSFGLRLEAKMLGGPAGDVMQNMHLWNYNTSSFEIVDTRAMTTSDSVVEYSATGDLDRFVNQLTGEITAMVSFNSFAWSETPFFWSVEVDQLVWTID